MRKMQRYLRRKEDPAGTVRFRTSEELNGEYGSRWIDEQTNEDGRHTTQVKNTINSYQKGFTKDELKNWCEEELGDGYTVEIANSKNAGGSYDTAVVVTKNNDNGSLDSEELFASLQNKRKDSNEYNRTVNELVGRIQKGWTEILGERTQDKRGTFTMVQGACEIISRDRGTVSGSESVRKENKRTRREIEDGIESWAKENNAWLDEGIKAQLENGMCFHLTVKQGLFMAKHQDY